jgi:hypothetical protein
MSFDNKLASALSWVNSHPESEERAKYVLEYIKGKKLNKKTVLSATEWEHFQKAVKNYEN